jgi:peptide/nickel transport system substrate-binding protein
MGTLGIRRASRGRVRNRYAWWLANLVFIVLSLRLSAQEGLARDLTIGLASETTSLDPHFYNSASNGNQLWHLYDRLVVSASDDPTKNLPQLALSWRLVDETTWEFSLRHGVTFHDGTPFTADDVIFTVQRIPTVKNSPASFITYVNHIAKTEKIDDYTLQIQTTAAYPFLLADLGLIPIVSRKLHAEATTGDFNSGRLALGTGPYRLIKWAPGDAMELARNPDWWGPKQAWDRVMMRPIASDPARLAALLSGSVDLIEQVAIADLPRVRADPRLTLVSVPGFRTMYIFPDSTRDAPPWLFDEHGHELGKNPLKDVRVRRAISMAIDRQAIVDRIMDGEASAANQLCSPACGGGAHELEPLPYDPEAARRLLADAGYPNGWSMTLHGLKGATANDDKVALSVAQYLNRIGIAVNVEALPINVFGPRATAREYSFILSYFDAGFAAYSLRMTMMTYDTVKGQGVFNRMRYSNPDVDRLAGAALTTLDDVVRDKLTAAAMTVAMRDVALIPLISVNNTWAVRRERLNFTGALSARTVAMYATPAR